LNAACFTLPLLPAGGLGGAIPHQIILKPDSPQASATSSARHSRSAPMPLWSRSRRSASGTASSYTLDVYNLTNTTASMFRNEVAQNQFYNPTRWRAQPRCLPIAKLTDPSRTPASITVRLVWASSRTPSQPAPDPDVRQFHFLMSGETNATDEVYALEGSPASYACMPACWAR